MLAAVASAVVLLGGSAAFAFTRRTASRQITVIPEAATSDPPVPSPSPSDSPSPSASASPSASPSPTAATGPYRVVGLGDSVPAGNACDCTPYVSTVGQQEAARLGRTATVSNLAQGGLTTDGLAAQLDEASVRSKLARADLVIVTIGANDFDPGLLTESRCQPVTALSCYQGGLSAQRSTLSGVLSRIGTLNATATVLVTGYWNVFLDGAVGRSQGSTYVRGSNALTLADNAVIASVAAAHGGRYVDIYAPFKGDGSRDDTGLLAADGDHPDAAGHALIARTLLAALN